MTIPNIQIHMKYLFNIARLISDFIDFTSYFIIVPRAYIARGTKVQFVDLYSPILPGLHNPLTKLYPVVLKYIMSYFLNVFRYFRRIENRPLVKLINRNRIASAGYFFHYQLAGV